MHTLSQKSVSGIKEPVCASDAIAFLQMMYRLREQAI